MTDDSFDGRIRTVGGGTPEQQKFAFAKALLDVDQWCESARGLLVTAASLVPSIKEEWKRTSDVIQTGDSARRPRVYFASLPYLLLVGYGVEVLLKAAIVAHFDESAKAEVVRTGRLPAVLDKHDLRALARQALFSFDEGEGDLLERLTNAIKWVGRYPIDKAIRGSSTDVLFTTRDPELAEKLLSRLQTFVVSESRSKRVRRTIDSIVKASAIATREDARKARELEEEPEPTGPRQPAFVSLCPQSCSCGGITFHMGWVPRYRLCREAPKATRRVVLSFSEWNDFERPRSVEEALRAGAALSEPYTED